MNNMKILIFVLLSLMTSSLMAQNHWKLVYENDADGNSVAGNLAELITVIRSGEEVRLGWLIQSTKDPSWKIEHFAEAKFITIMNDGTVQAQIDPIIGQTPDLDELQIVFKENLEWSMIASTNGKTDRMMRNPVTGEITGHQIRKGGIKWFVKR